MSAKQSNVEEIFYTALEKESLDERQAYLNEACGVETVLRADVESLLSAHDKVGNSFEHPVIAASERKVELTEGPGTVIGRYRLLQEIGEGGFGVVYMAEQQEPVRRKVALKIIKLGMDTKLVIARFEAERQALAMMDHPNMARVLDAGSSDSGRPYFVMDLVEGVPITEYCDKNQLSTRERLELFMTVCHAIQHAHQKGIIHRDLKPANIMVTLHDGKPVPKIIDFGVSKAISQQLTEKTLFTAYGQMVGTPQYMSPEQAEMSGLDIDTRCDIYSLGVLSYELLTGRTPLDSERLRSASYSEMQRMICEQEPLKPSTRLSTLGDESTIVAKHRNIEPQQLRQLLRGDLDWIVMKALDKERGRRYDSASRLADDVRRFLRDEAVEARSPSTSYVLRKFVRRNKGPVVAGLAVSAALVAGVIGTSIGLIRAEHAAKVASLQAQRATRLAGEAQESEKRASLEAERYRRLAYLSDMNAALSEWQSGDAGRAAGLLKRHVHQSGDEDLRGFEWYYLFGLCQRFLMTPTIECNPSAVAFSPDGKWLALGDGQTVQLVEVETGQVTEFLGHDAAVWDVAFSPDGKLLASVSWGVIRLWDVHVGTIRSSLRHDGQIWSVEFSPDRKTLASCSWHARSTKLWDVETEKELTELKHKFPVTSVAFSSDGAMLASCDWEGTLILWNVEARQEMHRVSGHSGPVKCVTFAPNQNVLASAGDDGAVKLWTSEQGRLKLLRPLQGHVGGAKDLAFLPTGQIVASGGKDNTVKLWDVATGEELDTFRGVSPVVAVAFAPGGKTLAAANLDGIRLWDAAKRSAPYVFTGPTAALCYAAFSPNGKLFVAGGWDGIVRTWDTDTWQVRKEIPHAAGVFSVAISPDGKMLATAGEERTIRLWNLKSGEPLAELFGHPGWIWSVAFSPDGQTIISAGGGGSKGKNGTVRFWNLSSSTEITEYRYDLHPGGARMAVFSPDGRVVASGGGGTVRLWEIATQRERILTDKARGSWTVAFSPNGRQFAVTAGRRVKCWDLATGEVRTFDGDAVRTMHVAFTPDRKSLVTAGDDGIVRLWNPATLGLQYSFPNCGSSINYFAISPDGKMIALCCRDARIRLLRAASDEDVRAVGWNEN